MMVFFPTVNTAAAVANYVMGDGSMSVDCGTNPITARLMQGLDPYAMRDMVPFGKGNGYSTLTGKTPTTLPISGRRGLIYVRSQSNAGNVSGATAYNPANPNAIFNINPFNGLVYKLTDPILGADGPGASFVTRLADGLVSSGLVDTVTVINMAVGATTAAQWASGGICYHRIFVAHQRVLQQSSFAPSWRIWIHHQGESDTAASTAGYPYQVALESTLARCNEMTPAAMQFVGKVSFYNTQTSAAITRAQASVVSRNIRTLGDFDTIDCTGRSAGCIDYNTAGVTSAASIAQTQIQNWLTG
jgi:hypothetical protein